VELKRINLEDYFPVGERVAIDVKELLFMGLVLKEKDFREWIKTIILGTIFAKICRNLLFFRCHCSYMGLYC